MHYSATENAHDVNCPNRLLIQAETGPIVLSYTVLSLVWWLPLRLIRSPLSFHLQSQLPLIHTSDSVHPLLCSTGPITEAASIVFQPAL